ncbi:MAG: glycoside hydrolase family 3 C-terminal domain-containing protein [Vicinamibacteria bacterium]|nr:glycoside hydrolase family 3 C-terminal domain-containing protein [Vicinamibacteria bacterium]
MKSLRTHEFATIAVLLTVLCLGMAAAGRSTPSVAQPVLGARTARLLDVDGLKFKDLNKNGRLDAYEDWRRPTDERVNDLVSQMRVEEKAGMMVGPTLVMGPNGTVNEESRPMPNPFGGPSWTLPGTSEALSQRHITQFINRVNTDPKTMVGWLNGVQQLAEGTRLGIPAFFVTNPRNHLGSGAVIGIDEAAGSFSQWPGTLGLAATRDPRLVQEFASMAAQEYVSMGIRGAYHPQADLATEPRWARISGTLGEDAEVASQMLVAMMRGFQGPQLGPQSVALVVKHFPGGGPVEGGQDSHFVYGKNQVYPGGKFSYHLVPFRAAINAGAVAMMPYYSIPKGITKEEVGMAFNSQIVTDLLRNELGFKGVVNSDSGITTSMVWGVERLTVEQRYKKAIDAGTDLIGNDATPDYIVNLVKSGQLSEKRIDESVRRILRVRFALGIFENPYADAELAARTVNNPEFQKKADLAQRKSIVVLKNSNGILPLRKSTKVYVEGIDPAMLLRDGLVAASRPEDADVCILRVVSGRMSTGSGRPSAGGPGAGNRQLGAMDTGGAPIVLTLPAEQVAHIRTIMRAKPTVVAIHLDRPYVIPELALESAALLGTFGVSDQALLAVLTGAFVPTGKLPFELPASMDAVRAQKEDVPYDSKDPLFAFAHGLTYHEGTSSR